MAGTPGFDTVYTANELLSDLEKGIWGELTTGSTINIYLRNLQNTYVDLLQKILTIPDPSDAQAIVRAHLLSLRGQVKTALMKPVNGLSRMHLHNIYKKLTTAV